MAASSGNTNSSTPFFGCKISLISKSEIRYEGILYTIDPKESTIALAKVRSFGSEDRPVERPVPPRDDIFEFIIFRASDIKDLIVDDPPPAPQLTDPAIIQAQHSTTSTSFPSSFSQSSISAKANGAGPAAVASQAASQPKAAPVVPGGGATSAGGQQQKQPRQQPHSTNSKSFPSSFSQSSTNANANGTGPAAVASQAASQSKPAPVRKPTASLSVSSGQAFNKVAGGGAPPSAGGQQQKQPRQQQQHQQQQQQGFRPFNANRFAPRDGQQQQMSGPGGFRRGGFGGGHPGGMQNRNFVSHNRGPQAHHQNGMQHRNFVSHNRGPQAHHQNGPKFPPLPDGDFDFEKAQADFKILEEKLSALKLNGVVAGSSEGGDGVDSLPEVPGIPASALTVAALEQEDISKEPCYNKTKSFFDSISCEALEREKGTNQRVDWKMERKMNRETFGVVSARRPTFYRVNNRGGFGGGGYRGGYHQQRGHHYNNNSFQNRNQHQQQQQPQQQLAD